MQLPKPGARLTQSRRRSRATRLREGFLKRLFTMKVKCRAKATVATPDHQCLSWSAFQIRGARLQHEFVYRHLGTKYDRVARILGWRRKSAFVTSLNPAASISCRNFASSMRCRDFATLTPAPPEPNGRQSQHAARFEHLEQRTVHLRAVDAHERRVVIGKKRT